MPIEGRLTICNLSIELGAKIGFVAPDAATFEYVRRREFAPKHEMFDRAVSHWASLAGEFRRAF